MRGSKRQCLRAYSFHRIPATAGLVEDCIAPGLDAPPISEFCALLRWQNVIVAVPMGKTRWQQTTLFIVVTRGGFRPLMMGVKRCLCR